MSIEQTVNHYLLRYPGVKKIVKRTYQLGCYALSKKIKSEGNIVRVSPNDPKHEYFFGYYDKSPWDISGRYMLCMRAKDTWSEPDPIGEAEIVLFDLHLDVNDKNYSRVLAKTHTWNVQQGCMAQWLGPDFSKRILYNDLREGKYCSVILDIDTMQERVLPMPVYTVSCDGKIALTLDFSRLHNLRPGYGYSALPEKTEGTPLPDTTCIWKMDIVTGEVSELLKYTDFANFEPTPEMDNAVHKVNHLMLSPNGQRFIILHRWFQGQRKYTRILTCNVDGTGMFCLNADGGSHCFWKNDHEIIAFELKTEVGGGYFLMKDRTSKYKHLWPQLDNDGHPSYCPTDNTLVVFDTYPSRTRIQEVKLGRDNDTEGHSVKTIARVFSPFKYDNNTRCDLHPRWSRDGKKICFDSVFEGHRGLYVINV